jgi:CRP/FNR family transcriptional regulator, cyclic AMP receptor protein
MGVPMGVVPGLVGEVCRVLDLDGDLAEAVPVGLRERAARECLARVLVVSAGRWRGSQGVMSDEGVGLLVLGGLLLRRVGVDGRFGAELLGAGDLLRPWQGEDELPTLPVSTGWRVIEPARMAVLDEGFVRRLARYPQLNGRLVGRALRRSRYLAVNMAIVHQARVDVRLHMLFWQLAARWGRVRSGGVSLPLRLTHSVLADLAAAQRPTVTSALSELAKRGLVAQVDDGWLLSGNPPGELLELVAVPPALDTTGADANGAGADTGNASGTSAGTGNASGAGAGAGNASGVAAGAGNASGAGAGAGEASGTPAR